MSQSVWTETTQTPTYFSLTQDEAVDVCVVGAGIAGLATAYLLQKAGKRVCILDAHDIGSGQTGRTTAQLSPILEERYRHLETLHGEAGAKLIAQSHQEAIDQIEQIIRTEGIECEFRRLNGYLFLGRDDQKATLEKELESFGRVGIANAELIHSIPNLPFKSGQALLIPNQAEFHPLKFIHALAELITRRGGKIYTHSLVNSLLGGEDAVVTTDLGFDVYADAVVVATNSPINDLFAIHTKQAPYRTYVIGAEIPKNSVPRALYWDTEDPYHYVRLENDPDSEIHDVLLIGGADHKTGQNQHPETAYADLEKWARARFPMMQKLKSKWSGQVMESMDGIGFLGHNPMDRNNIYVITGDTGNGMTHGLIGAQMITDQILNRPNPYEVIYDPSRKNLRALPTFLKENANVAVQYGDWVSASEIRDEADLQSGEGAVIRHGAQMVAVYKDQNGACHRSGAACPHLGAIVHWNSAEKSWDCPCHGSRFDAYGRVIEGPACSHLKPVFSKPGMTILPLGEIGQTSSS